MAVWPTTIDDDATGTGGTVVNDALFDAVKLYIDDRAGALTPTYTTITISDQSGAGLGVLGTARVAVFHSLVFLQLQAVYPATASGLAAKIGPLPYPNNGTRPSGFYVVYGPSVVWHVSLGATQVLALAPGTMAAKTNAEMQGSNNALVGFYMTV